MWSQCHERTCGVIPFEFCIVVEELERPVHILPDHVPPFKASRRHVGPLTNHVLTLCIHLPVHFFMCAFRLRSLV